MKFLTDQDVYGVSVRFLSELGHDVVTAAQLGLAQTEDSELLRVVQEQGSFVVIEPGRHRIRRPAPDQDE